MYLHRSSCSSLSPSLLRPFSTFQFSIPILTPSYPHFPNTHHRISFSSHSIMSQAPLPFSTTSPQFFPHFHPPPGSPSLSTLSLIHNAFTTLVSRYPSTILNLFSLRARRFPYRRVPTLIRAFNYLHAPSSTNAYPFVAELYRFTCVHWLAGVSWY